jgi:hypothetical protein
MDKNQDPGSGIKSRMRNTAVFSYPQQQFMDPDVAYYFCVRTVIAKIDKNLLPKARNDAAF